MDWPDEDGAESQGRDNCHASRYYDHDIMIEPDAGRTARRGAERENSGCEGGRTDLYVQFIMLSKCTESLRSKDSKTRMGKIEI